MNTNLGKEFKKAIEIRLAQMQANMLKATTYIAGSSLPKTPVDTGYLRSKTYGSVNGPLSGEVGNTAEYGLYVHENIGGAYRVGAAKFVENKILELQEEIQQILSEGIKA